MTNEYPKSLYRDGDTFDWDGRPSDILVVDSAEAEVKAASAGWLVAADYLASDKPSADILDRSVKDIAEGLPHLTLDELEDLKGREEGGKTRKGVLRAIDEAIEKKLGE